MTMDDPRNGAPRHTRDAQPSRPDDEGGASSRVPGTKGEGPIRQPADAELLLKASTTGLIALDKTGLIVYANPSAADLLGGDANHLLKKPFSLFIVPEDQATFYTNRSRIVTGHQKTPFEIKLKQKDGALRSVRIHAQPMDTPGQRLPGMLLAVDDITAYRNAVERLQYKEDSTNLMFSVLDDLAAWSAADMDTIINYTLEKLGLVSGADRVYVGLFHERRTRLSITHEWLGDEIVAPSLHDQPLDRFGRVLKKIKDPSAACVVDISALPPNAQADHNAFHAQGVRSFLYMPLVYGRRLLGMIGCDAVRQSVDWSTETRQMVKCIGDAITQALIRRQMETAPDDVRHAIFQWIAPASQADEDQIPEYDGPIEFIDGGDAAPGRPQTDWQFQAISPDDPGPLETTLLKDGKIARLACNHCNRQRQLDIAEIRVIGTHLKAICVCGNVKSIKVELRREQRKTVNLKGVFIRGQGERLALKSEDWGHMEVKNLSRRGVGFKTIGKVDIRIHDRLRVNFTLDNTARSIIQKEVVVRSVTGGIIGCQFESQDACDVTLGFYMMN